MANKDGKLNIDDIDRQILNLLQKDASLTIKEIAQVVQLSTTPCWKRVQRLEQCGVIKAKVAILDGRLINANTTVFIMVKVGDHSIEWDARFAQAIEPLPQIMEIYRMSGDIDYILRAVVSDIVAYDTLLKQIVSRVNVRDITSMFAIEQVKYTTALPV